MRHESPSRSPGLLGGPIPISGVARPSLWVEQRPGLTCIASAEGLVRSGCRRQSLRSNHEPQRTRRPWPPGRASRVRRPVMARSFPLADHARCQNVQAEHTSKSGCPTCRPQRSSFLVRDQPRSDLGVDERIPRCDDRGNRRHDRRSSPTCATDYLGCHRSISCVLPGQGAGTEHDSRQPTSTCPHLAAGPGVTSVNLDRARSQLRAVCSSWPEERAPCLRRFPGIPRKADRWVRLVSPRDDLP